MVRSHQKEGRVRLWAGGADQSTLMKMPIEPTFVFVTLHELEPLRDAFGRWVGDEVVSTVAERLQQAAGTADCVTPFGDGSFAVRCDDPSVPASLACAVARPVAVLEWEVPLRATFRVCTVGIPLRGHERAPGAQEGGVEALESVA